jgi:uncharacterized protein YycO
MFGDLIAFENDGSLIGKAISKFTTSNIIHVGIMLYYDQFIEASPMGIRLNTLNKVRNKNYYNCSLSTRSMKKIRNKFLTIDNFIEGQLNKPYDFNQLFKFIPYYLSFGLYTPKENNKLYVCSELAAKIYEIADIIKDVNTSIMSPIDVFNLNIFERITYHRKEQ